MSSIVKVSTSCPTNDTNISLRFLPLNTTTDFTIKLSTTICCHGYSQMQSTISNLVLCVIFQLKHRHINIPLFLYCCLTRTLLNQMLSHARIRYSIETKSCSIYLLMEYLINVRGTRSLSKLSQINM